MRKQEKGIDTANNLNKSFSLIEYYYKYNKVPVVQDNNISMEKNELLFY